MLKKSFVYSLVFSGLFFGVMQVRAMEMYSDSEASTSGELSIVADPNASTMILSEEVSGSDADGDQALDDTIQDAGENFGDVESSTSDESADLSGAIDNTNGGSSSFHSQGHSLLQLFQDDHDLIDDNGADSLDESGVASLSSGNQSTDVPAVSSDLPSLPAGALLSDNDSDADFVNGLFDDSQDSLEGGIDTGADVVEGSLPDDVSSSIAVQDNPDQFQSMGSVELDGTIIAARDASWDADRQLLNESRIVTSHLAWAGAGNADQAESSLGDDWRCESGDGDGNAHPSSDDQGEEPFVRQDDQRAGGLDRGVYDDQSSDSSYFSTDDEFDASSSAGSPTSLQVPHQESDSCLNQGYSQVEEEELIDEVDDAMNPVCKFVYDNHKIFKVVGISTGVAATTAFVVNLYNDKYHTKISKRKAAGIAWIATAAVTGTYYFWWLENDSSSEIDVIEL